MCRAINLRYVSAGLACHDCLAGLPDSHPLECVTPDGVLIQVGPPDDEHLLLETCRGIEINTLKKGVHQVGH